MHKKTFLSSENFFPSGEKNFLNKMIIFLIEIYQKTLSKDHSCNAVGFCKFVPSCSEYAKESFKKYNFFKAFFKSFWRILRCNPFNKNGGIDLP
ncbi:membrane protein insertion efficiency factor YidD [Candidatus Gracilibacteria bacterium]|nr:membrane protein insertion efficiency factor YidD [Candidatus Gracilibacteria bacterium]